MQNLLNYLFSFLLSLFPGTNVPQNAPLCIYSRLAAGKHPVTRVLQTPLGFRFTEGYGHTKCKYGFEEALTQTLANIIRSEADILSIDPNFDPLGTLEKNSTDFHSVVRRLADHNLVADVATIAGYNVDFI